MKKKEIPSHFTATISPDKTLCSKKIRKLFISQYKTTDKNGEDHVHDERTRSVWPNSIYMDEIGNEKIFFILTSDGNIDVKTPMPVYCLQFSENQKKMIISRARAQGLRMNLSNFEKVRISPTCEERLDIE
jgi:hypothetical protein